MGTHKIYSGIQGIRDNISGSLYGDCHELLANCVESGGVRTTIAMHCGFKIFKMAAKVEKFRRLYALFFNRYSSFLRSFFSIS